MRWCSFLGGSHKVIPAHGSVKGPSGRRISTRSVIFWGIGAHLRRADRVRLGREPRRRYAFPSLDPLHRIATPLGAHVLQKLIYRRDRPGAYRPSPSNTFRRARTDCNVARGTVLSFAAFLALVSLVRI